MARRQGYEWHDFPMTGTAVFGGEKVKRDEVTDTHLRIYTSMDMQIHVI
jgi:hypothetical protein